MAMIKIKCIYCESEEVVKNRRKVIGVQYLKCKNCGRGFQERYSNKGAKPETKKLIISMSSE